MLGYRFVPGGGQTWGGGLTPPLVQNDNQAKFDPKNNQAKFARLDGELQSPNQGTHPETLLRERGFSLGFRSTLLRTAAVFVPWIQICTVILEHRDRAAVRVCQYEI